MFVKRYIAKDMSEAMEKIRNELGSEAVILSHRAMRSKGLSGLFKKKMVEVTVAYEPLSDQPIGLEAPPVQSIAPAALADGLPEQKPPPLRQAAIQSEGAQKPAARSAQKKEQPAPKKESKPAPKQESRPAAQLQSQPQSQPQSRPQPASRQSQPQSQSQPVSRQVQPQSRPQAPATPLQGVLQYQQAAIQARHPLPQGAAAQIGAATAVAAAIPASEAQPAAQAAATPLQTEEQRLVEFLRALVPLADEEAPPKQEALQPLPQAKTPAPEEPELAFEAAQFPRLTSLAKEGTERPGSDARIDELNARLTELKGVVRSLTARIITADKEGLLQFSAEVTQIHNALLRQDVQPELARSICEQVQSGMEDNGGSPLAITRSLLLRMLGEPAQLARPVNKQSVVMLTGPTGVGKTTTLVKLAGMYTIREGAKVGFINTDTYRVAAQAQLRAYAEILDIPCATVYAPDELPLALRTLSDCDLVLIDTAGKSTADILYQEELKALMAECNAHEVLLHVSASMSPGAATELVRYFSFLEGYKLVITKLDEVQTWGCLLNIAALAKKPVAFMTVGQKVPQDIEIPDMRRIVDRIMESVGT